MKSIFHTLLAVCASALAFGAWADTLYVTGTVTDSAGNPVDSAIVTVRGATGLGMLTTARDTTGANGQYSIVIPVDTAGTFLVTVRKGTQTGATTDTVRVANPRDGTADRATVNPQLRSATVTPPGGAAGDTVHVTGTVMDSAGNPVDSARVTVRVGAGGFGGGGGTTALTNASGQ